mmetsp:Transcript_29119/g.43884  ORF Transcript_29119/g.43884 Transcript_29119/m.43884 type:complete len:167 (+) Transcript_29119:92-592(+)
MLPLLAKHEGHSIKLPQTSQSSFFPSLVGSHSESPYKTPAKSPMSFISSPKRSPNHSPKGGASPFHQAMLKEKLKVLSNSPLFDPMDPRDSYKTHSPAPADGSKLYGPQKQVSEKRFPGLGTFHMYHRIDDLLVGVSVFDLTETCMNRVFFMYDPAYSFLFIDTVA